MGVADDGVNRHLHQSGVFPAVPSLGRHNLPPAVVLPQKMIRTDLGSVPRVGQFAGLLG
jgi:hypothetical protein